MKSSIKSENVKIKLKFWGEKENSSAILRTNSCNFDLEFLPNIANYQIRCNAYNFRNYLIDMENLKIYLLDKRNNKPFARVSINLLKFIKKR